MDCWDLVPEEKRMLVVAKNLKAVDWYFLVVEEETEWDDLKPAKEKEEMKGDALKAVKVEVETEQDALKAVKVEVETE